jgi:hypothetical protein
LIENRAGEPAEVQFITAALLQRSGPLEFPEEASFLRALRANAPERLGAALEAIDTYEEFCRPLIDAFNWIRHLASMSPQIGVSPEEYLNSAPTAEIAHRLRNAIDRAADNELLTELWPERADVLTPLREVQRPCDLLNKVIEHHLVVQQQKQPEPKRAWIEESSRQRVMVRPAYRLEEAPPDDLPYVHEYRIPTLSRFLADLHGYT